MDKKELEELRARCGQILVALGDVENLGGLGVSKTFKSGGLVLTGHTFPQLPNGASDPGYLRIMFKGCIAFCSEPMEDAETGEPVEAGWKATPRMVAAMQKAVKRIHKANPTMFVLDLLAQINPDAPAQLMRS